MPEITKHIVSFSGGRTSAYLVWLMEQNRKQLGWDVDYVFMDTGAEHPKTYEFIRKVVKHFGINLTVLKAHIPLEKGKGPVPIESSLDEMGWDLSSWREMLAKYSTPFNPGGGFCTDRRKGTIHKKYFDAKYGRYSYFTWIGIRADEPKRLKPSKDKRKFGFRYLAEISEFDKSAVLSFWNKQPFDLELDEWLGNCVFCIKKGVNKVALALKDEPSLAEEFWDMLNEDTVRNMDRSVPPEVMYRGHNSLISIRNIYANTPREELIANLRGNRRFEAESCSESCEVFPVGD